MSRLILLVGHDSAAVIHEAARLHQRRRGRLRLLVDPAIIDADRFAALFNRFFDEGVQVVPGRLEQPARLDKALEGATHVYDVDTQRVVPRDYYRAESPHTRYRLQPPRTTTATASQPTARCAS